MAPALTEQQLADLAVARSLAAAGIPIFLGVPDASSAVGFRLPSGWQTTAPDPAVVDAWQPGMALCAVMGHGLDLVDIDPRNGGDVTAIELPRAVATAATPSGGAHLFVASLGVGSRDNLAPGLDFKGGHAGDGHGFAFLAPTVRASKVDGAPRAYQWAQKPLLPLPGPDASGAALAARVRALRAAGGVAKVGGPDWWQAFVSSKEPQSQAAAEKAIAEKLAEVTGWRADSGAGFRQTLMRAAMTLGGYVGGGYLAEADAWARLEQAAAQIWGAADEDDRRWIEQGLTDGAASPFHVYTPEDEQRFGEAAQAVAATRTASAWSPYRGVGTEPFDPQWLQHDQEFAEAVAARTAPVLRYGVDSGTWLVRGAERWTERDDLSGWAVALVARLMPLGATPVPKDAADRTPEHWQAVRRARFMSSGPGGAIERKLRALVRAGDHASSIELAHLDADPEILWAGGQPWDLRASAEVPTLAAIDPATPHMHTALVAPERRDTPVWDRFVASVWPDPELRAWAMRVLSLTLAGYPDAALPVLYGPERTGKTALVTLLVRVLGSYGHAADPRLLSGADTTHASVVYALKGRRLSFIDEGPRRGHLAAERLKQLTGGGVLTGNAMRSNPITFSPTHTLVMTTNDEPPISDPALRARVRIIPCEADQAIVRAARQALTPAVWAVEAPGVLAGLMRQTAAWLADPDSAAADMAPAFQQERVAEMAAGQDPVREWVSACTVPADPGTPGRELYTAFAGWYSASPLYRRMNPPSETAFGRSLNDLGYPGTRHGRGNDRKVYRPLSVLGGPHGYAPWEPVPANSAGQVVGGLWAGSPSRPAPAGTPSSAPTSSFVGEGGDSTSTTTHNERATYTQKGYTGDTTQGNTGTALNPPQNGLQTGSDLGVPGSTPTRHNPAPIGRDVHRSEVAARAYQGQPSKQISKAEARRQLAEEKRQAAIVEAQGEVLGLPVVVDRDGHVIPVSPEQAAEVVRSAIARSGQLDVDVETSGYPVGHPLYALRSVQLGDAAAVVVAHPATHAELIRTLLAEAPALGAFSATADLVPLAHAGLGDHDEMWSRMHDVVIKAKLADPTSTGAGADGLKAIAGAVLRDASVAPAADAAREALFKAGKWLKSTKVDTPVEKSGWAQVETGSTTMVVYAASDVLDTAALGRTLPAPAPAVYERERLAQRMTARVAYRGVRIDVAQVRALAETSTAGRAEAAEQVRAFGIDNPGSNQQVAAALGTLGAPLPHSQKTGAPSVAVGVLDPLKASEGPVGELVRAVLDYRHHDTVLGTFLEPYRLLCEQGDGRARPTVYTLGTDTGRMSCVRPNLQQLPREGGVRACITADPGQLMIGADFSGVEIRVAAALSQDPTLLGFLADGRDLHGEIAKQVWGPEATKANRYTAKRLVFGRLYGGGIATLSTQAGVSQDVGQQVIDTLDALTPQLSAWSESVRAAVKQGRTQFPSYSGRVIHLPRDYPHKAPNYCIQGTARELLVDALVRWQTTRWGNAVLLPVHDELDVFVPEAEAVEATEALVTCMQTELYGVAIVADPSKPSFAWQDSS